MDEGLRSELSKQGVFTTTLEELYNWGRKNSVWPLQFGLACCAIEMIAASMARYDLARFGAEVFRPSPRQADLMIVAGTVTKKMAPQVVRLYNQMPEPKYVIAMGACAISGGPFKQGYNVLKGIDRYIPVDVHIPGCPPRPEALLHAFMTLQEKIDEQQLTGAEPSATSERRCAERISGAADSASTILSRRTIRPCGKRPNCRAGRPRGNIERSTMETLGTNQNPPRSRRARRAVGNHSQRQSVGSAFVARGPASTRFAVAKFLRDDAELRWITART